MRRVEHLINDIRFNSNQLDTNRFTDLRLLKLLNNAQRAIQNTIFTSDMTDHLLKKTEVIDLVAGQEEYSLPIDIYAQSSISSVKMAINNSFNNSNNSYFNLNQISDKETRRQLGYTVYNDKLVISPIPQNSITGGLKIFYQRKLPTLSVRVGQIDSFITGTSITLDAGYLDEAIGNFDDYISVVDANGTIKQSGISFSAYAGGVISTTETLDLIANGDYVVIGEYATTNPQIPDTCEDMLTSHVERSIYAVDSSSDVQFSAEETAMIRDLFQKKDHDVKFPVIINNQYMSY